MYCVCRYYLLSCLRTVGTHTQTHEMLGIFRKLGKGSNVKRIKGNIVYAALWLTGIVSFVLASGAPNKWTGGGG
jgi:hypothetical protein